MLASFLRTNRQAVKLSKPTLENLTPVVLRPEIRKPEVLRPETPRPVDVGSGGFGDVGKYQESDWWVGMTCSHLGLTVSTAGWAEIQNLILALSF